MSAQPYPIRPAGPPDAEAIARVHEASREALYRGHVPDWLVDSMSAQERLRRWREWLADPGVLTLVGEEDGCVVGFCTLRSADEQDIDDPAVAEMPTLYLHPTHWRRGWGTALCSELEERAAALGYRTLVLWVMEMNEGARTFYAARGFAEDGAETTEIAPQPTTLKALRYRKSLV